MGKISDQLNSIITHNQDGVDKLNAIFRQIRDEDLPIVRHTIFAGSSFIRQRINIPKRNFCHISELSYPPISLTSMGRANLPGHPMFYACSFPSEINAEAPIPRLVALEETSSFLKDKSKSGIERATVSRWRVVEQIELIALPYIGKYERACLDLKRIKEGWIDAISKGKVPEDPLELVNYMAEEISKDFVDKEQYFKIANFVNYLLTSNLKTKDADGIIYPSVPAKGAGFNVAIKPEVIDRKVRFENASICHFLKNGENMFVMSMSDAEVDEYGNIVFVDRILSEDMLSLYNKKSYGLSFIN